MNANAQAYGLWWLVLINSAIFIIFIFSFSKPRTQGDWRSLGGISAFIVALFAEMYGFPLTIYLLSGWLQRKFPQTDLFSHDSGHLWHLLLGLEGNPHFDVPHTLSHVFILGGFFILAASWRVLHAAQQAGRLAVTGPYRVVRHPQYDAFVLIMFGFLLQWPTILTLLMFPILVTMYVRLARREEADVRKQFGSEYDRYAARTPAFFPRLGRTSEEAR